MYLSLLGGLLGIQVCVVHVCKGLGLDEEVPQVLLEGCVVLQLEHALDTCLQACADLTLSSQIPLESLAIVMALLSWRNLLIVFLM